jgi:hypothetical protein
VNVLKFIDGRPFHWRPACQLLHALPSDTGKWTFDGNLGAPSFSPSFKQFLDGDRICHDSSHALAGQHVPLPEIPDEAERIR